LAIAVKMISLEQSGKIRERKTRCPVHDPWERQVGACGCKIT